MTRRDPIRLRRYQREAVAAILRELEQGRDTLGVLPTGTGKTIIFAKVSEAVLECNPGKKVLVLAHRDELIWQNIETLHRVLGERPDVEKADIWAGTTLRHREARVIVSSIQTQVSRRRGRRRMERFRPSDFCLVIVDEAHHSPSKSYRRVLAHYQSGGCRVLGVTATPDRADKLAMGSVYESVAYRYEIAEAVADGWLVPIRWRPIRVSGLDLSGLRKVRGDFSPNELSRIVEEEKVLHRMAWPIVENTDDLKTIVFCVSLDQARGICAILNRHKPGQAKMIDHKTPIEARRMLVEDYRRGKYQYLVNVGIATEGFDVPDVQCICMCRPTMSRALYAQMVGRGMRPLSGLVDGIEDPEDQVLFDFDGLGTGGVSGAEMRKRLIAESSKPCLRLIEFTGNTGRHKLCCPADLLGGKYPSDVRDEVRRKASERGVPSDLDVEAELELAKKRMEATRLAEKRRQEIRLRAVYDVNEFELGPDSKAMLPDYRNGDFSEPATDAQIRLLARFRIDARSMTKQEASRKIARCLKGGPENLPATEKQLRYLRALGVHVNGHTLTRKQASQLIDQAKKRKRVRYTIGGR